MAIYDELTMKEVSQLLGVSRPTLYRRIYAGDLVTRRNGYAGYVSISLADLETFMRRCEQEQNTTGFTEPILAQAQQLITAKQAARAARTAPVPMTGWAKIRQEVIARDGLVCRLCGGKVPADKVHIDHIIPRIQGGTNALDNLRVTHGRCNLSRGGSPSCRFCADAAR